MKKFKKNMKTFEKFNMLKATIINEGFTAVASAYDLDGMERKVYSIIWCDKESDIKCSNYVDVKGNNLIHIYLQLYTDIEKDDFRDVFFFKALRIGSIYDYIDDEYRDIFVKDNMLQLCAALNVVRTNFNVDEE